MYRAVNGTLDLLRQNGSGTKTFPISKIPFVDLIRNYILPEKRMTHVDL